MGHRDLNSSTWGDGWGIYVVFLTSEKKKYVLHFKSHLFLTCNFCVFRISREEAPYLHWSHKMWQHKVLNSLWLIMLTLIIWYFQQLFWNLGLIYNLHLTLFTFTDHLNICQIYQGKRKNPWKGTPLVSFFRDCIGKLWWRESSLPHPFRSRPLFTWEHLTSSMYAIYIRLSI